MLCLRHVTIEKKLLLFLLFLVLAKDGSALNCHSCVTGLSECDDTDALQRSPGTPCALDQYCMIYNSKASHAGTFSRTCVDGGANAVPQFVLQLFGGAFPVGARGICGTFSFGKACICKIRNCNNWSISYLQPLFDRGSGFINSAGQPQFSSDPPPGGSASGESSGSSGTLAPTGTGSSGGTGIRPLGGTISPSSSGPGGGSVALGVAGGNLGNPSGSDSSASGNSGNDGASGNSGSDGNGDGSSSDDEASDGTGTVGDGQAIGEREGGGAAAGRGVVNASAPEKVTNGKNTVTTETSSSTTLVIVVIVGAIMVVAAAAGFVYYRRQKEKKKKKREEEEDDEDEDEEDQ